MEKRKSFWLPAYRSGMSTLDRTWSTSLCTLYLEANTSSSASLEGTAFTGTIVALSPNLVLPIYACSFFSWASSFAGSPRSRSVLLKATMSLSISISPSTIHSAVCVYISFWQSTTSTIRSIMLAPPITVFISEAWPGQSTSVNWMWSIALNFSGSFVFSHLGTSTTKALKPKSRVMPRSLDYGLLSKPAVLATVLSALHKLVLPESMWPNTPMFMFSRRAGFTSELS